MQWSKANQAELNITRERMIELLNEDLAGEYQAIIGHIRFIARC